MTGKLLISQNKAQNGLKKVHVTLSISELARDYAKINRINLSSLLENTLKSGSFNIKKSYSGAERLAVGISSLLWSLRIERLVLKNRGI